MFNEEILLTVCFLSFLFYCFNTLSDSIFASFESRAAKFEQDLLSSYNISKVSLINEFYANFHLNSFKSQFSILMLSVSYFLAQSLISLEFKSVWFYHQTCVAKLNELVAIKNNFADQLQKICVIQLLYSLILKKSTKSFKLVAGVSKSTKKLAILKILSVGS